MLATGRREVSIVDVSRGIRLSMRYNIYTRTQQLSTRKRADRLYVCRESGGGSELPLP
jgi:hypothetical protein